MRRRSKFCAKCPKACSRKLFSRSISNCQTGLVGISFGDFLIKRVVDALEAELPRLKQFATLSPVPGFRAWLNAEAARDKLLLANEVRAIQVLSGDPDDNDADGLLLHLLERPDWHRDTATAAVLREPLLRLAARYLLHARAGSGRVRASDPVAHFHLSNGARVERLNWLADTSANGLKQSYAMMVNYRYKLGDVDANHETYAAGKIVASREVRALAKA